MSGGLVALICGQSSNINKTPFSIPIKFEILNDVNEIEVYVDSRSPSTRFIVLLCDDPGQLIYSIAERLSTKANVIVTLICKSPTNNLPNLRNVCQISKHLVTYKTVIYSMRAYLTMSKQLYELGQEDFGAYFRMEAEKLVPWLRENIGLPVCHILIIPLNTDSTNLKYCQQDLLEMCKTSLKNKEIIVCTLYDYILFEESDLDFPELMDSADESFRRELKNMVLNLIPKLAPIRLYLVGNDDTIPYGPSKVLVTNEQSASPNGARKYIDQCTFIQYEPIANDDITTDLAHYLRATNWQLNSSQTKAVHLSDIKRNPTDFINAVESIYGTLRNREDHAKLALWMQDSNFREKNPDISDGFHSTGQAQTGPMDQDDDLNASMSTRIQSN